MKFLKEVWRVTAVTHQELGSGRRVVAEYETAAAAEAAAKAIKGYEYGEVNHLAVFVDEKGTKRYARFVL